MKTNPLSRAPLSGAGPSNRGMATGNNAGNLGRRVKPMPALPTGPPNPMLDNTKSFNMSGIVKGAGLGDLKKAKAPRGGRKSAFFGE